MKPAAQKPAAADAPEPVPGVDVGDDIYVHHKGVPCTGRVVAHGRHGCTVHIGGQPHPVRWDSVLGHKKRAMQRYAVVDEGEDGMIVKDASGRRRYIAIPNESQEDPMVAKAQRPFLLFAKAAGAPPRPGLTQKKITDKNGTQTTKWVRVDRRGPPAQRGQHVGFKNGEHRGHGEVTAAGQHGVTVRDRAGGEHRVRHEQVTHHWGGEGAPDHAPHETPPGERPNYEPRLEGEGDKQYAKRVVDKGQAPSSLPEEHDRYFNTEGSTHVELDKLHSTKTDDQNQQGGDNGPKRMQAAYHGALGKRDAIKVMPHAEKPGHYEVVDGNGTLTSAKKLGWKGLPTQVVSRDEGVAAQAEEKCKALFDPAEVAQLPRRAQQPHASWKDLSKHGPEALTQFNDMLGGVAKALGLRTDKKPKDMKPEDWASDDGHLFLAPLKGADRAKEKVEADYDGDWSRLCDLVRGTIAVSSLDKVPEVLKQIRAAGLEVAQRPKNRMAEPTETGYRDLLMIVKLPSGMMAELQVNLKSMQEAKSGDGHAQYDITRGLQAKYGEAEPTDEWDNADHTEFYRALKAQKDIYGAAWQTAIGVAAASPEGSTPGDGKLIKSEQTLILVLRKKGNQHGLHRE